MPDLRTCSVIIPAYNAAATIRTCLEALEQQTVSRDTYEILVIDDGSTDGTPARVQAHFTPLDDPRVERNKLHELTDSVTLVTDESCGCPVNLTMCAECSPLRSDSGRDSEYRYFARFRARGWALS